MYGVLNTPSIQYVRDGGWRIVNGSSHLVWTGSRSPDQVLVITTLNTREGGAGKIVARLKGGGATTSFEVVFTR